MPSSMKVLVHSSHLRGYWSDLDITLPKEHLVLLAEHPVAEKISYKMECGVCQYFVLHLPIRLGRRHHSPGLKQRPQLILLMSFFAIFQLSFQELRISDLDSGFFYQFCFYTISKQTIKKQLQLLSKYQLD